MQRNVDIRHLLRRKVDKRGRSLQGFETASDARREHSHRVALLRSSKDPRAKAVANALSKCRSGKRCGSNACPKCGRLRRIRNSATILRFLAQQPLNDLRYLTLINPADALPAGALHKLDPRKLIHRYRRQFERAGIDKSQAQIIAYLDGEWDAGWDLYQPHIHAVVQGVSKKALKALVAKWPSDPRVRIKKRLEPIDDLARVVAYLDKTFWPSIARKNNNNGVHPHAKRRPHPNIEIEILIRLHSYKSTDLVLLYGVKRYGKVIM